MANNNTLLLVCLILFASGAFAGSLLDYGIMIDAGSTGCRIYLYDWPHRDNNSLPLVEPTINQTIVSLKNNNPLSGYVNNPQNAGQSLSPLIDYIIQNLDEAEWPYTPLYLKATAGMRALNLTSQEEIMESVREYLTTTPFIFTPDQAQVIPGTYEGVFGWITTNYAAQVLTSGNNSTGFGTLDMGGASTQITFVPQDPPKSNEFNLGLANSDYGLYTYSYPLGQDASLSLLISKLISYNVTDGSGNIVNPCFLSGYNETDSGVLVVGSSDYDACVALIEKFIVVKDPNCDQCGVGEVYQPPIYGDFYAFSGFTYTWSFFGLQNVSNIAALQSATSAFCSLTWDQAVARYNIPPSYIRFYCFTGSYYQGYGFDPQGANLIVQAQIGNFDLSWALGAMIYEASLLPINNTLMDF